MIRVGAHPGVLPATVSAGTDFEKNRWTPGIYDSVSLALSDNPGDREHPGGAEPRSAVDRRSDEIA